VAAVTAAGVTLSLQVVAVTMAAVTLNLQVVVAETAAGRAVHRPTPPARDTSARAPQRCLIATGHWPVASGECRHSVECYCAMGFNLLVSRAAVGYTLDSLQLDFGFLVAAHCRVRQNDHRLRTISLVKRAIKA